MLLVGPKAERQRVESLFSSMSKYIKTKVTNLRVIFDCDLTFLSHFNKVAKTSFFHLRNIARIRPFLTQNDAEMVVNAFITSRLDYCNSVYWSP